MVDWITSTGVTPYEDAVAFMENRVDAIINGTADECIWLVEHPPLYTAGTSAKIEDLTDPNRFPVHTTKRGGQYTYHGPGQRVAYVMLDVGKRGHDVRCFVRDLEAWVIATLDQFNIKGEIRDGRVGVWVQTNLINVEPDLSHFNGIVPCGITEHGVTSLVDLGLPVTIEDVDVALRKTFEASMTARDA
ncbi:Octanoyltransferase [Nymphon striatum]|nr:Octanoyltransferase [Nymphon striatum]